LLQKTEINMEAPEFEKTKSLSVVCQGKEAPYDHPRIYLYIIPKFGKVQCPYCSKEFIYED